jgi:iron(III) transport system permease protein
MVQTTAPIGSIDAGPVPTGPTRRIRRGLTVWSAGALAVAVLVSLPMLSVVSRVFVPTDGVWAHLVATVLPGYVANSLMLATGVVLVATSIGVTVGWLVAACDFPGRRMFEWALMLPLAMPAYVIAYVYYDRLSYWGPVQSGLRSLFGWERDDYWFPRVASLEGAILLMGLVLYPYIYLLARAAFLRQSVSLMEAARGLGCSPFTAFWRVALPMAWPAIVAGAAFVVMETLADYGTVIHLGVQTLTTGIFRTWFSRGAPVAAAQLAALLLAFVATALFVERWLRGRRSFADDPGGRGAAISRHRLGPWTGALASLGCALPVLFGFLIPAGELLRLSVIAGDPMWGPRFVGFAVNSLTLAAVTAVLLVVVGVFLGYARRLDGRPVIRAALQVASFGYAIPGAVIAVGVLVPLAAFDNAFDAWARATLGISTGLLLTGSLVALVFAYVVRFLAIALKTVEASLLRIPPSLDEAARSLGADPRRTLLSVHLPLLRPGLLSAAIFVFADVMKELPATLIVRPFNFDTLAVRVHRLASDGRLEEGATAALVIVAVGIVPVIVLSRAMRERPNRNGRHAV